MKYAHVFGNKKQTISEHVNNVANLASVFSCELVKSLTYVAGMAHDIGKYSDDFQRRLLYGTGKFEHSSCGAIELNGLGESDKDKCMLLMIQYCVAGHHTGLPDGGTKADSADGDTTLCSRLKRGKNYTGSADYSSYKEEIVLEKPDYQKLFLEITKNPDEMVEKYSFFVRYIFSCLTDADFIDTEKFCNPDIERGFNPDFAETERLLNEKIDGFSADTLLQKSRRLLQDQAYMNSGDNSNISILNMPTGSGKTLCSMKIALRKLREHGKKRIIYVIPYTSIIEQTADVFNSIFEDSTDIIQHYSNYDYSSDDSITAEKIKRSTENWDAPIVITTSVQFFQSLYHYRSSGLRKMHNMADSVIVFDEIHMLPVELIQPCLRGIGYITKYLNSEAIFLSATMPDYRPLLNSFISEYTFKELITDKSSFKYFQKCRYSYLGKTDIESIAFSSSNHNNSLIIVNSRKTARELYKLISGKKYHLSTYMTPEDRSETIKMIRNDIENDENITVVSTSLVEAGVDLSFEAVYRQLAGLDSILQSGGRCNREGKLEYGDVYIFETDEKPQGEIQVRANIVKEMFNKNMDITSDECVKSYYSKLFAFSNEQIQENSISYKVTGFDNIPFRTYAEKFQFIKEETVGIVINNNDKTSELLSKLKYSDNGGKNIKRKLQRYTVSLKMRGEFDEALSLGIIDNSEYGIFVLTNNDYYDPETGLNIRYQNDYFWD